MKKLFVTILTILTCGTAYSLPVGNPADATMLLDGIIWEGLCPEICDPCITWCDAVSIRIGFYGDYVFNRHLEVDQSHFDAVIEDTEIFTNAGYIALNFYDRLDLFTTLGATNLYIETDASGFNASPGSRIVIESNTDFSWSLGIRGTIWECGCTMFGAEAQYFYTRPDLTRVTLADASSVYNDHILDAKYREWQFGIGVSHRIHIFVPYLAVKWSWEKLFFDSATFPLGGSVPILYNLRGQKCCGWALGVSVVDCEKLSLTVEGRFADEKALHVNGQLRF
jgi:major outer membrane protein